ncbi:Methyltransferase domain-containing protein [Mucilaginibacter sp. OK283]|nr:Methyltransferase domain-containing protein [Mucilaginibacter sp. OK283]
MNIEYAYICSLIYCDTLYIYLMTFKEKLNWEIKYITTLSKTPIRLAQYLYSKFHTKLGSLNKISYLYREKRGLEIGGPSPIFGAKGYIPVYPLAKQVDGVNFSNNTVWENTIKEGPTYSTGANLVGHQYILDGIDLNPIASSSYDFILSSHSLEHIANPIKALKEWLRVLKTGGALTLILPNPKYTFDHKRPITKLQHLIDDYNKNTDENDLTHLDEVLTLHDFERDGGVTDMDQFKQRCLDNINNRCMHQHVYNLDLLTQIFNYLNVTVLITDSSFPHHLTIVGIKQ